MPVDLSFCSTRKDSRPPTGCLDTWFLAESHMSLRFSLDYSSLWRFSHAPKRLMNLADYESQIWG